MFLFLKLILAHLIADFILQFEELYQLKVRSIAGHILHVLIHGSVSLFLLTPYLKDPWVWVFVIALTLIHLLQDLIKYGLTKKYPANTFIYFIADQVVHVLVISTVFLFPFSQDLNGFASYPGMNRFYLNDFWTLLTIFFILLTFAANYTFHAFYQSYVKRSRPMHWISSFELSYTLFERTCIAGMVFWVHHPLAFLLIPLIGLTRLPWPVLRNWTDFGVSLIYSLGLSFLFRSFL